MKNLIFLLFLSVACTCCRESPDQQKKQLMQADLDFCKMAADKGIRDAFVYYSADEVVMMRDGALPLFGKPALLKNFEKNTRKGVLLTWFPVKAEVSGDLGYTFGNWTMKIPGKDTTYYGNYVTIWKKQPDGSWKYVLDGGNSTPKP